MSELADRESGSQEPLRGEVMDVAGVAEYLGLSPSTIYDKVQSRDIPHVRIGNLLRFPKKVIDRWLAENTIQPTDPFYREFVRMANRYFFGKWLEGHGADPAELEREELSEMAWRALLDLREHLGEAAEESP